MYLHHYTILAEKWIAKISGTIYRPTKCVMGTGLPVGLPHTSAPLVSGRGRSLVPGATRGQRPSSVSSEQLHRADVLGRDVQSGDDADETHVAVVRAGGVGGGDRSRWVAGGRRPGLCLAGAVLAGARRVGM